MFDTDLPDFPFPVIDSGVSCKVYAYAYATGTCVYNKYRGYRHICEDELRIATGVLYRTGYV